MRTWKNVELRKPDVFNFKFFLNMINVKYETSECFNLIHFECLVDNFEELMINNFLENL